jgi:hypothetical protein
VTGWEHAHEHGRGSALLASVEADWLQEDHDVMGTCAGSPPTWHASTPYGTSSLSCAPGWPDRTPSAAPRTTSTAPPRTTAPPGAIVTDSVTGLAARLTEQERSGHRGGAGRAAERITSDQRREVEALAEVGHGHDRTASGADLRLGSQVEVVT